MIYFIHELDGRLIHKTDSSSLLMQVIGACMADKHRVAVAALKEPQREAPAVSTKWLERIIMRLKGR